MTLAIGLLLITHLVCPVAGLVWLWRGNELSKLEWLLKLSIVLLYGIQIFLIGRWDFLSYFLRFGVIALLVVAVYVSLIKAKSLPFYPTRKLSNYVSVGISSLVVVFLLFSLSSHISKDIFSMVSLFSWLRRKYFLVTNEVSHSRSVKR